MQTLFRNPLASPDLLGISSGAALGVAIVILAQKYLIGILPLQTVMVAASIGAISSLVVMLAVAHWIQNAHQLLIIGFMFTTLIGACINLLQYFSQAQELQQYVLWTYGSLSNVTWEKLPFLVASIIIGLSITIWQAKSLNALLLGQDYAQTMGVAIQKTRWAVLLSVGLMVGTITALCGFIGFVAVAVPQLAALWLRSPNHHILLPVAALMGASFLLFCDILCYLPATTYSLPINVVTSLLGSPFIVWLLLRKKY
jgi:iron complex transport system permease protein